MQPNSAVHTQVGLWVFCLVLAASALIYSGTIHALDQEEGMLLVTDSLVRTGWFDVNQHLNISDPTITLIPEQIGPDGNNYLKFGFPTSLLAVPLYLLAWVFPFGAVQSAFLLNPLLTALTALLLFYIGLRLGYAPASAAITALGFGVASMALVYTRFFGSEPLVGFSFALAVWGLLVVQTAPPSAGLAGAAWAGFAIGLGVATRPATVIVLPIFGGWFLWVLAQKGGWQTWLRPLLAFALPGLVWLLLVLAYNWLRFGSLLETGYGSNETFDTPLLTGLYGQLFSSGKGLFFYSPLLVLAFGGIYLLWQQRQRSVVVLLLGSAAAYLALYSVWFGWWGGVYWGPRHAAPVIVLLTPLTAPLIDAARHQRLARVVVAALFALGVGVQALGGLMNFEPYEVMLNQWVIGATQAMIWLPLWSPILYHLTHLRVDDVIWVTAGFAPWLPVLGLGVVLGLAGALAINLRQRSLPVAVQAGLGLAVVGLWSLTLWHANQAPPYGPLDGPRAAIEHLNQTVQPGDVLLSRTGERTTLIMNDLRARVPWHTFDARPTLPEAEVVFHLERVTAPAERLWLLTPEPRDLSNPGAQFIESWLSARSFPLTDTVFGPSARLVSYQFVNDHHWTASQSTFGAALQLAALWYGISSDFLLVALQWQTLAPPETNYSVSLQLLDANDSLAAQIDRWPVNATRPTLTWQPNETLIDRYALPIVNLPPGDYTLWLVVYDGATLARLPITNSAGESLGDRFFAGTVTLP